MITIDPPSSAPTHKSTSAPQSAGPSSSELSKASLSKSSLTRFLNRARQAVGLEGEVEVLLTSDSELKRLNRTFRGKNKATDVLSFPAFEGQTELAGDLAISLDTAARQAAAFGHSLRDEVQILLLHGLLHLSGLDHETDDGEMRAREDELRQELRLPTSLIARVEVKTRPRAAVAKKAVRTKAAKSKRASVPAKLSRLPKAAKSSKSSSKSSKGRA